MYSNMKKVIWIINALFFACLSIYGQNPVIYKSFDDERINTSAIKEQLLKSANANIGFTPTFNPGIKGLALDLTDDVGIRIPVVIDPPADIDYNKDFSISLWVKTKPHAQQGSPIVSNKKDRIKKSIGWEIGTNISGAWYFNISDGEEVFDYEPTHQRQKINDGLWHNIIVSVNMQNREIWFYFDGVNVAIYNIDGFKSNLNSLRTIIGGSDEYFDGGSRGEWMAFNGMIDEVAIFDYSISKSQVKEIFSELKSLPDSPSVKSPDRLKVQVWNIWHGGRRFGQHVGVERVIEILKQQDADIIGLIETYGSGAIIADSLGYHFYLISSNLSIMSRYPIESSITIYKPFNSGGAIINTGNGNKVAFINAWLDYRPSPCELVEGESVVEDFLTKEKETRQKEINTILAELQPYIDNSENIPVFMTGDFNCGSHLDWTDQQKDIHNGVVMDWKVSRSMYDAGFRDSFRDINPDPLKDPGFTWSPLINNNMTVTQRCIRNRIDFIYYKGSLTPYYSKMVDYHPKFWPSDHGSVVSYFYTDWKNNK